MMVIRDLDTMVSAVLQRIINANVGITNTRPGSVIRTIIESILAEMDIVNFNITQVYNALGIDKATGDDLDNIVKILSVVRLSATKANGTATFYVTEASTSDIEIPYAQIISTRPDANGNVIEFMVTESTILAAGEMSVAVDIQCTSGGEIFIPIGGITVMNTPIIGIAYVTNEVAVDGGTDVESDESVREHAKSILATLGKGTKSAILNAVLAIPSILDATMEEMTDDIVGKNTLIAVADVMPLTTDMKNQINAVIQSTKSAGIMVLLDEPSITNIDITIETTAGDNAVIRQAAEEYCGTLSIGDIFVIKQMERYILNKCNISGMDITVSSPLTNTDPGESGIVRVGLMTINGDV